MAQAKSKKDKVDNKAAMDFLARHAPDGPWALTTVDPERKKPVTISATFFPGGEQQLLDFLDKHNGHRNIYFSINPTRDVINKKSTRENIASLSWLHVDIDPRAKRDPYTKAELAKEQKRLLAQVSTDLPKDIPEPTWVIFSGGGYQAAWRLETPLDLDGSSEAYEDAKLWNMQLESEFGADNCHNVDRILRLPGTMNLPDKRKREKGRVAVVAELVEFNDNSYPLTKFTKRSTADTQNPITTAKGKVTGFSGSATNKVKVKQGAELDVIVDLDTLDEYSVPAKVKVAIAQGRHPDDPLKGDDQSRSAWLFFTCCQLARCKVPDEMIYALIMDKEWLISESILELGNGAHNYAVRNIERAKEYAVDPHLERMNSQFAYIAELGTNSIVEEVVDPINGRSTLKMYSFQNIHQRFCVDSVEVGRDANDLPKYEELGKWWTKNPDRRSYDQIAFAPEIVLGPNIYNLWKGFACEALPGDCDLFLAHLKDNLCSGVAEHYTYLIGWLANMIQNPAQPGEVAIVLRGGRGTGKSFFASQVGRLLGRHYLQVSNGAHLTGNFNAHLRDLVLLFADEAFAARDKKHESVLKTLITEDNLTIEAKGQNVVNSPNFIHLIMASNDKHVIPAGEMERRFFVLDVGAEQQQKQSYFKQIADQMDNGGLEALLHYLRTYDLDGFNVRNAPVTDALQEQKVLSQDATQEWWFGKLDNGEVLPGVDFGKQVEVEKLREAYYQDMQNIRAFRPLSSNRFGAFCKSMGLHNTPGGRVEDPHTGESFRPRIFLVPHLEQCRAIFEEQFGGEVDWTPLDNSRPPDEAPF